MNVPKQEQRRKVPEDPRRQFYPSSKLMTSTRERVQWMCQDKNFCEDEINRMHTLALDHSFWLQFRTLGPGERVSLQIEITQHGKPTRDGVVYWWPVIEQWYQMLLEWQGRRRGVSIAQARLEVKLLEMKQRKLSYAKIADCFNEQVREARQKDDDIRTHSISPLHPGHTQTLKSFKTSASAEQIIKYFAPRDNEASGHLNPITAAHVRERLRTLLKQSNTSLD
jgi:hypothetical protein